MKNNITITQATLADINAIMSFMDRIWKKDHILSKNKQLFLYEFQNQELLNMIIAKDSTQKVVGIFGFIYYNNDPLPDIAGSLWKVDEALKEPFLGLKLREYFKKHIKHNFFAAPGANLATKPIYKMLKMHFNVMDHYYIANENLNTFHIAKNPKFKKIDIDKTDLQIKKINSIQEIESFHFPSDVVPKKDLNYIQHRFFDHPLRDYDIYALSKDGMIKNIFICRVAKLDDHCAYRVVDFYGGLCFIENIVGFLYQYILQRNYEYFDFISYGLDGTLLQNVGFSKVDYNNEESVIPNLFEPFVQQNLPIYCVSDKTDKKFLQFKADGDQDRPNMME